MLLRKKRERERENNVFNSLLTVATCDFYLSVFFTRTGDPCHQGLGLTQLGPIPYIVQPMAGSQHCATHIEGKWHT